MSLCQISFSTPARIQDSAGNYHTYAQCPFLLLRGQYHSLPVKERNTRGSVLCAGGPTCNRSQFKFYIGYVPAEDGIQDNGASGNIVLLIASVISP